MKPFPVPAWRKRHINQKYARKNRVIVSAVTEMEEVMKRAVDEIYDHAVKTHHFAEPSLNEMFTVSDRFYRRVVEQSFYSAEEEKKMQVGRKRLGKAPPKMPRSLRDLHQVFGDKRYWPKIMKRSKVMTERLRKSYIRKLRKKFDEMMPRITSGEWSPAEAKTHLMETWKTSRSRVENIFRTETTNYFGKTQVAFFENDPEILGFLFDSIKDTARTDICRSRHGLIYRPGTKLLRENTPACHWQCRSHLIALANTPYNRKMLSDPDRDPSKKSVVPLPSGWRK